jgi:hypothetical protein
MDTKSYTSFIPKTGIPAMSVRTHSSINLFFLITLVIFLLTLGAAGALYVYKLTLDSEIASINKELVAAQNSLYKENIDTWQRLDSRISLSKSLIQSHIATSLLFKLLEDQTMRKVQLNSLDFNADPQGMKIGIKGTAANFATLAVQADALGTEAVRKYLKNTIISDVGLDPKGLVTFNLSATLDPRLVSYGDLVSSFGGNSGAGLESVGGGNVSVPTQSIQATTTTSDSVAPVIQKPALKFLKK